MLDRSSMDAGRIPSLSSVIPRPCVDDVACLLPPSLQPAPKKQRLDVDGGSAPAGETTTVFVGNLPWSATEDELKEFFAECGEINGVRIGELGGSMNCIIIV